MSHGGLYENLNLPIIDTTLNEHLYIEGFQMEILDIEDDMMAFIDSLI